MSCVIKLSKRNTFIIIACIILTTAMLVLKISSDKNVNESIAVSSQYIINDDDAFLNYKKQPFAWTIQSTDELAVQNFDLFTPPSIFKNGDEYTIKTYNTIIIDDTFPLYLFSIKKRPYRIKLEGYTRVNGNDKEVIILLRDIETGAHEECRVDTTNKNLNVRIEKFELIGYEKNGIYYEEPCVTIYDNTTERELKITDKKQFFDDKYLIIIKDINGNEYTLKDIGDSITIGDATCTLRSFDPKEEYAKLLLQDAEGQEFRKTVRPIK